MNMCLKKDGIFLVMLAGACALWLVTASSLPQKTGAAAETPPAKEIAAVMQGGKIDPALAVSLFILCSAGFGIGLVADLVIFLYRKTQPVNAEDAAVPVVREVPWDVYDIFRITVIFFFFVSVIHAVLSILLAHGWVSDPAAETIVLVAGTAGMYAVILFSMHRLLIKGYAGDWSLLGISLKKFFRNAVNGLVGYIAFVPAFFILMFASLLVCRLFGVQPEPHEIVEIFSTEKSPYKMAYLVILAVGLAPLYEEIVFRGFIYGVMRKHGGVWSAMAFSALFFAVIHFNAAQFMPVFGMGMMLAYLYESTGTLVAPIVFHAINNGIAVLITLLILKSM